MRNKYRRLDSVEESNLRLNENLLFHGNAYKILIEENVHSFYFLKDSSLTTCHVVGAKH